MKRLGVLLVSGAMSLGSTAPAAAQTVVRDERCGGCRITTEQLVRIDDLDSKYAIGSGVTGMITSEGSIWLASYASPGEIGIYDSTGRHRRTVGRLGEGPGEFKMITRITQFASGRIAVIDASLVRLTLFRDTVLSETIRLPGTFHDVFEFGDGFLVQGPLFTPDRFGKPLHIMNQTGTITRSLGANTDVGNSFSAVAPNPTFSTDSAIWIGKRTEYRFEKWSKNGELVQSFVRSPDWFVPWSEPKVGEPTAVPPSPALISLVVDSTGYVWLLFHVADANWSKNAAAAADGDDLARLYDSIIEVIDPVTGRLVQSVRLDDRLQRLLPGCQSYSMRHEPTGNAVVEFWIHRIQRGR